MSMNVIRVTKFNSIRILTLSKFEHHWHKIRKILEVKELVARIWMRVSLKTRQFSGGKFNFFFFCFSQQNKSMHYILLLAKELLVCSGWNVVMLVKSVKITFTDSMKVVIIDHCKKSSQRAHNKVHFNSPSLKNANQNEKWKKWKNAMEKFSEVFQFKWKIWMVSLEPLQKKNKNNFFNRTKFTEILSLKSQTSIWAVVWCGDGFWFFCNVVVHRSECDCFDYNRYKPKSSMWSNVFDKLIFCFGIQQIKTHKNFWPQKPYHMIEPRKPHHMPCKRR